MSCQRGWRALWAQAPSELTAPAAFRLCEALALGPRGAGPCGAPCASRRGARAERARPLEPRARGSGAPAASRQRLAASEPQAGASQLGAPGGAAARARRAAAAAAPRRAAQPASASAEKPQGSRRARARLCSPAPGLLSRFLTPRGSGALSARARGSAGLPARHAEKHAEWTAVGTPCAGSWGSDD